MSHIPVLRAGCIITRDTGIKYEEQIQLSLTLLYISYFTLKSGSRLLTQKLQTDVFDIHFITFIVFTQNSYCSLYLGDHLFSIKRHYRIFESPLLLYDPYHFIILGVLLFFGLIPYYISLNSN